MQASKILWLLLLLVMTVACRKNRTNVPVACGVKDPLKNLAWLRQAVDSLKEEGHPGQVTLLTQGGQDYINIQLLIQSCYFCTLYACDGDRLVFEQDSAIIKSIQQVAGDSKLIGSF